VIGIYRVRSFELSWEQVICMDERNDLNDSMSTMTVYRYSHEDSYPNISRCIGDERFNFFYHQPYHVIVT
jgi:hypothetical protein